MSRRAGLRVMALAVAALGALGIAGCPASGSGPVTSTGVHSQAGTTAASLPSIFPSWTVATAQKMAIAYAQGAPVADGWPATVTSASVAIMTADEWDAGTGSVNGLVGHDTALIVMLEGTFPAMKARPTGATVSPKPLRVIWSAVDPATGDGIAQAGNGSGYALPDGVTPEILLSR